MAHKKWDINLVGVLASEDYVEEKIGKPSVFINSQQSVQFNIKVISETPESFPNVNLFSAFTDLIEPYGFEDLYADPHMRKDALREFLEDKLIVFKPIRKLRPGASDVYQATDARLYSKTSGFHDNTTFIPVPIFSEMTHGYPFEEFIEKLKSNRFVGRIDNLSTESNDTPEYVIWKEADDEYTIVGQFESHRYAHGGFAFQFKELKTNNFKEDWFEDAFEDKQILFMSLETYRELDELMKASVGILYVEKEDVSDEFVAQKVEVQAPTTSVVKKETKSSETEIDGGAVATATAPLPTAAPVAKEEPKETKLVDERSEDAFLELLLHTARERSLLYEEKDLVNFHTAMKSSNLVILAGMSGTGKSKLVEVYARALGFGQEDQLSIIPVRPSWTDDADLIGYVDSIHNIYRPGDSGLVDVLKQAQDNPNKLYIVCFDEMNLARVEHYFSQFLSVLELAPNNRRLRLYNDDLELRLYNAAQYPSTIKINDNVMFVGTVNLDESTHHFSDKVLDRANVITLHVLPFSQLRDLKKQERKEFGRKEDWTADEYRAFKNTGDTLQLLEREISFMEEIHKVLQSVNKNFGIGHRIVRQIDSYLKNLPQRDILTRQEALDLQVIQRILTKLRGPEDQLKALLGNYDLEKNEVSGGSLFELIQNYQDISQFEETRQTLQHKSKELRLHGYTV